MQTRHLCTDLKAVASGDSINLTIALSIMAGSRNGVVGRMCTNIQAHLAQKKASLRRE